MVKEEDAHISEGATVGPWLDLVAAKAHDRLAHGCSR